jgi:uncharacterized membrane protein
MAAGLMYLLGRQRGKRRRRALPAAANLAARRVTDLAEAARRLRPRSRNGLITRGRPHRVTFLGEHPWTVFGAAASILAAGMWGLWRREPGHIRMATTIEAPIERVFDAWSRFEDFPRFMPMVAQVRPVGDDRWQWTISEPGGELIEFVSRVTQRDRPHMIAWATDGGAVGEHSGTVRFRPTDSGTRMEIEMSRHAVGGAVGEGAAVAAGVDPERALREGLAAFKTRLEAAAHQGV